MSIRLSRRVVAAAVCVLLAGCATTGKEHLNKLDGKLRDARVVTSFRDVTPKPLVPGQAMPLALGMSDQAETAMQWGEETTFVKVLALPEFDGPYSISISSHMIGTLQSPAIFYPQYVMLDADFKEVRRSETSNFTYRRGLQAGDGLTTTIFVNDVNRGERYVALLSARRTDAKTVDSLAQSAGTMQMSVPVKGGFLMWMIPMGGSEKPTPMTALAGGRLTVLLTPYRPKRMES